MNWHHEIEKRCAQLDTLIRSHEENVRHFQLLSQTHRVIEHQDKARAYTAAKFELRRLAAMDQEAKSA